jgi:chemotaxis protein CheC
VTPPPPIELTELEQDALAELANIGVSRAAANLRIMVGSEVLLSVPTVKIITREQTTAIIGGGAGGRLVAVHQSFEGALAGRSLLIFPETHSLELVRAITGGGLPLEDIIGLEQEALAETGNIILNGCLAAMANMLDQTLQISLPEILSGSGSEIFALSGAPGDESIVLFLYINFSVRNRAISGYIAVLMDLPSLTTLKTLLGKLIAQASGTLHGSNAP